MTDIRLLTHEDRTALEDFLLPRVATSMFLIGNMRAAGLVDRGEPFQGTYAAAVQAGQVIAVVAHYWNGNLVFQAPVYLGELWRLAVGLSGRPIEGLIGPQDQIGAVTQDLVLPPSIIQLDETEKLYSLDLADLLVPDQLAAGRWVGRRATRADLHLLVRWRIRYSVESLGEVETPESLERGRVGTARAIDGGTIWILEDRGRPVATSAFNTAILEAVQVGAVWTPPALRSRGYGRAVVAASCLDARAEGAATAILFTGQENVPAQRAYEALNFRHMGAYRLVLLRSPYYLSHGD